MFCPRCNKALGPSDIPVVESACGSCRGVFLAGESSSRILEEQGFTRPFIGELQRAVATSKGVACVGCGREMQQVPLRGRPVDLCPGCGGLWLDGGELGPLTGGKFENGGLVQVKMNSAIERARVAVDAGTGWIVTPKRADHLIAGALLGGLPGIIAGGILGVMWPVAGAAAVLGAALHGWEKRVSVDEKRRVLRIARGPFRMPLWSSTVDLKRHVPERVVLSRIIVRGSTRYGPRRELYSVYESVLVTSGKSFKLAKMREDVTTVHAAALAVGRALGVPVDDETRTPRISERL